jgi:outer membrane protein OmpA-like peptidoglycan-associated protein
MKKLIFLLSVLFSINLNVESQDQVNETFVEIFVNVTDFNNNVSIGDKVGFTSKKTNTEYSGISDEEGKFSIFVPRNDVYQVTIKSFEGNSNYCAIQVPEDKDAVSYSITVLFELPKSYILKDINFDTGKSTLKPSSNETLDNLVELMKNKKTLEIELSGHTDDVGDEALNLELSDKRALVVKNYLVKNGIESNRIKSVGYGENQPIASNSDELGRSLNRRTEVKILE